MPEYNMTVKQRLRFLNQIHIPKDVNSCWIWQGLKSPDGYGRAYIGTKSYAAHRISYEFIKGEIPAGLHMDHLCRHRDCVNPRHLEPVTLVVNVMRGFGRPAMCARVTHCPNGHPYEGEHLYIAKDGSRKCRTCIRERMRMYRENKRQSEIEKGTYKRMTKDKQRDATALLMDPETRKWSSRIIGEQCDVSDCTVDRIRKKLIKDGLIPNEPVFYKKHGKVFQKKLTMNVDNPSYKPYKD